MNTKINKALKALADGIREPIVKDNMQLLLNSISAVMDELNPEGWGVNEDEREYFDTLDELYGLLSEVRKAKTLPRLKTIIKKHISSINWENFKKENDNEEYYSLGSVWYTKLSWIEDGSGFGNATHLAKGLCANINAYFDELEKIAS